MTEKEKTARAHEKLAEIEKAHESGRPPPDIDDDEVTGVLHLALDKFERVAEKAVHDTVKCARSAEQKLKPA